jgi:putative SOS response-associated peptidase YedK
MCGRFIQYSDPEVYAARFDLDLNAAAPSATRPRYNIAPSQPVLAIRVDAEGRRRLDPLRWGLVPSWSKGPDHRYAMINARAETVAERTAYRAAFRERRCLIPTEGFYEWRTECAGRQPYLIRRKDRQPFAMAGLWEHWAGNAETPPITSCTIIVTDANPVIAAIHDRMPVILDPGQYAPWLDPDTRDPAFLLGLLQPAPPEDWTLEPVSRRLNKAREDDPGLIEPLPPSGDAQAQGGQPRAQDD